MGHALVAAEVHWLSRRGLWQLIFGGVFERHPQLKLVLTEQRVTWVPETLRDLDTIHASHEILEAQLNEISFVPGPPRHTPNLPRRPSEYWADSCFIVGSFMAPYEVEKRHDLGMQNLLWGSDYPHTEGTWPNTRLAMRHAFSGVPEDDVRLILGGRALDAFD